MGFGSELAFVVRGCETGIREDGRSCKEWRPASVQTDVILSAIGSSRVRLGGTDVLVGIKFDLGTPHGSQPHAGRLHFSVECSPCIGATHQGRAGEAVSAALTAQLEHAFDPSCGNRLDLSPLCIVPAKQCLVLQVDVLILSIDGSLPDAASLAIKAALGAAQVPSVTLAEATEGGEAELQLDDDPSATLTIDTRACPLLVSVARVGNSSLMDLTATEEACCSATVQAVVSGDQARGSLSLRGDVGVSPDLLLDMFDQALGLGPVLDSQLAGALKNALKSREVETA